LYLNKKSGAPSPERMVRAESRNTNTAAGNQNRKEKFGQLPRPILRGLNERAGNRMALMPAEPTPLANPKTMRGALAKQAARRSEKHAGQAGQAQRIGPNAGDEDMATGIRDHAGAGRQRAGQLPSASRRNKKKTQKSNPRVPKKAGSALEDSAEFRNSCAFSRTEGDGHVVCRKREKSEKGRTNEPIGGQFKGKLDVAEPA